MSLPSPTHSGGCRRWLKTSWKPFASAFRHSNQRLPSHGPPTMWTCSLWHGENFMSVERKMSREEVRRRIGLVRDDNQPSERQLIVQCAADITPEPVEWLWPGRIAIGKQTLLAGEAGLGKSQVTIELAAAVTNGGHWPCDEGRAPLG